jgi:ApaG protein
MSEAVESRSEAVTSGVRVAVRARFIPERSNPGDGEWLFAYTIRITNESAQTVQLLSRHWVINNADGKVEEVRGPGVVGQQPILGPGQSFEYTSACPLGTSFGVMQGTYQMVTPSGDRFDIAIAPFSLHEPYAIN